MTPKSATPTSATTTLETENARMRKNPSGIIGSPILDSHRMKRAMSTAAAARKPRV